MPDKVVIITGASRGIGRAAAVELAHRGCAVSLIARSAADLDRTAQLCQSAGTRALVFAADICDERALANLVARTAEHFGRIDGIVNNAGYAPQASVEETDAALFEKTIAINLTAAMTLSRLAWPYLKGSAERVPEASSDARVVEPGGSTGAPEATSLRDAGRSERALTAGRPPSRSDAASGRSDPSRVVRDVGSCIVNVSSMSAVDPRPGLIAYAAAKAGLLGLTSALAREGDAHNIRSVAIILGGVETEMFRGLKGAQDVPAESLLTPHEVAVVIAECLTGPLVYSSGEAVYLRKRV